MQKKHASLPLKSNFWQLSRFRFSAWEYREEREQFYLHKFIVEQPDLNYRNEEVRREMNDVLVFWLDKGVDGFRFDAVLHIFEDEEFRDEPRATDGVTDDPDDYYYLDHIYTYDLPETKEVALNEMYQTIKNYAADSGDGQDRYIGAFILAASSAAAAAFVVSTSVVSASFAVVSPHFAGCCNAEAAAICDVAFAAAAFSFPFAAATVADSSPAVAVKADAVVVVSKGFCC